MACILWLIAGIAIGAAFPIFWKMVGEKMKGEVKEKIEDFKDNNKDK